MEGSWRSVRNHMTAGRRQRCIGACLLWYFTMETLVGGGGTEEGDAREVRNAKGHAQIKVDRSSLPYKLTAANGKANSGYWSQSGQDKIVDELLQGATGLFFVEAGGYDGETLSNSLFFEHSRGWQGMVIEPNPHLYTQILGKRRHCMTVNAAISPHDHQDQLPFVLAGPLGGFASTLSEGHQKRIEDEIAAKKSWMDGELGSGKTILVESYPLEWLLEAGNQTRLVVDYWSLDTEGSEPHILRATNFSRIQVGVMSIEHNGEEDKQRGIRDAMVSTGLVLYRDLGGEYIYVNPTYFSERGWNLPGCGGGQRTTSSSKECDDGNLVAGDGCSASCQIECGWECAGGDADSADACFASGCGDKMLGGEEECDDGNTEDGDGCSSSCMIEEGYSCMHYAVPPYPCGVYGDLCTPMCGDGLVKGSEVWEEGYCDDGNLESAPCTDQEASSLFDVFEDTNNVYGLVGSSDYVHYLGIHESPDACAFACVHYFLSSGGTVKMGSYVWHPRNFPSLEWQGCCFGRSEAFDVWNPKIQKGVISGRVRPARWRRWLERLSMQQRTLLQASAAGAHSQKYPLL